MVSSPSNAAQRRPGERAANCPDGLLDWIPHRAGHGMEAEGMDRQREAANRRKMDFTARVAGGMKRIGRQPETRWPTVLKPVECFAAASTPINADQNDFHPRSS